MDNSIITIQNKIYTIRGIQVMLDRDIALLYEVETRAINQAVKRNEERFPEEFCFQLTEDEFRDWRSQIVISNQDKMGLRRPPFAFTEQGVAMLSAVLKSKTAIAVSVDIMKAFVSMRRFILSNAQIFQRLDNVENKQKIRVKLYTKNISKQFELDIKKYREQYGNIEVIEFSESHDRFIIIDEEEIYHFGASLKDLGKKWVAFSSSISVIFYRKYFLQLSLYKQKFFS